MQASKKATTAAQFYVDASKSEASYEVLRQANCAEEVQLCDVVGRADDMQYPSSSSLLRAPHDVYTKERADEARELARTIFERCLAFTRKKAPTNNL